MSPLDVVPGLGPGGCLCLADCLRRRNPGPPPAPRLPENFLLAAAMPLPLPPELEHQRPGAEWWTGSCASSAGRKRRTVSGSTAVLKPLSSG